MIRTFIVATMVTFVAGAAVGTVVGWRASRWLRRQGERT